MIHIKKILHKTDDAMYILFTDDDVRILRKDTLLHKLPEWQQKIITDKWMQAKVDDFGALVFSKKFDIGGDTLKADTDTVSDKELLNIIHHKRIAKKRIINALSSLL
jgi:hypothetical protein